MTKPWPSRRSTPTVRRGDLREREILDAAEKLIATHGYVHTTVGHIAEAAGITRGALYFYFSSKQDVLVALVARTVHVLREGSAAVLAGDGPIEEVVGAALEHTARQWREHGVIMRAAVDFASTVPEVDRLWTETALSLADAITTFLIRSGVPDGDRPDDAPAMARVLCWMVERSFYQASRVSAEELDLATRTCVAAWLRIAHT